MHVFLQLCYIYRGADKSLAWPTSQCILFDASVVKEGVTGGTDQTSGVCSLC